MHQLITFFFPYFFSYGSQVGDVTGRSSDKARVIDGLSYVSLGSYQGVSCMRCVFGVDVCRMRWLS